MVCASGARRAARARVSNNWRGQRHNFANPELFHTARTQTAASGLPMRICITGHETVAPECKFRS